MQPVRAPHPGRRIDWSQRFARLALTHLLSVCGETMLAVALAGSLFFKVDPSKGRTDVLLGLVITMAPFAIVGPFLGPLIDRFRGGHRMVIVATMAVRAMVAVLMMMATIDDSLLLFPEVFVMLVLAKTYQVARSAVVPHSVTANHELVEANAKLQMLGGLGALVAGGIAAVLLQIDSESVPGAAVVLGATALTFGAATVAAVRIAPAPQRDIEDAEGFEAAAHQGELPDAAVRQITVAMGILRLVVGLTTMLIAWELRGMSLARKAAIRVAEVYATLSFSKDPIDTGNSSLGFGIVLVVSMLGGLGGASVAPRLRHLASEARIIAGASALTALAGIAAMGLGGLLGQTLIAATVALATATAKQAYDSFVQRHTPALERGAVFARVESVFQFAWVMGALIPTAFEMPFSVGVGIVVALSVAAGVLGGGANRYSPSGSSKSM